MNVLCLGLSYTARYLATHFKEHNCFFLSRQENIADFNVFSVANHKTYASGLQKKLEESQIDVILDCIPTLDEDNSVYYSPIVLSLLEKKEIPYIHISSTSVFPSSDEISRNYSELPCYNETSSIAIEKLSDRGKKRMSLEQAVLNTYPHAQILRSTGIYGPSRSLVHHFYSKNFRRARLGNIVVSRIHVHDLLRLFLAMSTSKHKLVCGVDEYPAPYREVIEFLKENMNFPIPIESNLSENPKGRIIRSIYASELLEGTYMFPTFREGFHQIIYNELNTGK